MALPLTEPDPLAWRVALRLAQQDQRRLKVMAGGAVVVLNNPVVDDIYADLRGTTPAEAAEWPREAPALHLESVRAAGGTHLVPVHGEYALCGTRITGPWAAGQELSCPACMTKLPPEA